MNPTRPRQRFPLAHGGAPALWALLLGLALALAGAAGQANSPGRTATPLLVLDAGPSHLALPRDPGNAWSRRDNSGDNGFSGEPSGFTALPVSPPLPQPAVALAPAPRHTATAPRGSRCRSPGAPRAPPL